MDEEMVDLRKMALLILMWLHLTASSPVTSTSNGTLTSAASQGSTSHLSQVPGVTGSSPLPAFPGTQTTSIMAVTNQTETSQTMNPTSLPTKPLSYSTGPTSTFQAETNQTSSPSINSTEVSHPSQAPGVTGSSPTEDNPPQQVNATAMSQSPPPAFSGMQTTSIMAVTSQTGTIQTKNPNDQTSLPTGFSLASTMSEATVTTTRSGSGGDASLSPSVFTTTTRRVDSTETKTKTPDPKEAETQTHHGTIVAAVIAAAILLMSLGIFVACIRKRQLQKQHKMSTEWAGPSPFLEGRAGNGVEMRSSNRISIASFLPQRLSKRLSLLTEGDAELKDMTHVTAANQGSTFGQGPDEVKTTNNTSPTPPSDKTTQN